LEETKLESKGVKKDSVQCPANPSLVPVTNLTIYSLGHFCFCFDLSPSVYPLCYKIPRVVWFGWGKALPLYKDF